MNYLKISSFPKNCIFKNEKHKDDKLNKYNKSNRKSNVKINPKTNIGKIQKMRIFHS